MFKEMFGKIDFGSLDNVTVSHLGIAVKNADGRYVSYDKANKDIVDVTPLNFNTSIFRFPVALKDVSIGDAILHNKHFLFVENKDTEGNIIAIDVAAGTKITVLPTKSMFGFDFITKVVSFFDFMKVDASESNPFGSMFPLLLMQGENSGDMLLPLFLMQQQNGGDFVGDMSKNPMLMAMMFMNRDGGGSKDSDFFTTMLLMNLIKQK